MRSLFFLLRRTCCWILCTITAVSCYAHNTSYLQTTIRQDVDTKKWYIIVAVETKAFADATGISLKEVKNVVALSSLLNQSFVKEIKTSIKISYQGKPVFIGEGAVKTGYQTEAILELQQFPAKPTYLDITSNLLSGKKDQSNFLTIFLDTLSFHTVFNSTNNAQRIYFNSGIKKQLYVFNTFIQQGFLHVFPWGYDHILFITGLFFFNSKLRSSLIQSLVFTLSHSLTLVLSALKIITLPSNIIELIIAVSIAYIAIENIFSRQPQRFRLLIIFIYGLFHGLGFSSAFKAMNIPEDGFLASLSGFNLGVEIAQATIILCLFFCFGKWFSSRLWYKKYFSKGVSVAILLAAIFMIVERIP